MDIKRLILDKVNRKGQTKVSEIIKETGFSRAYINRFFKELRNEGKIILIGKANKAYYVKASQEAVRKAKQSILKIRKKFVNKDLSEDLVLDQIKRESGIFFDINKQVLNIMDYAFTEMLNNAIDHSDSRDIEIFVEKKLTTITFEIRDYGIGIFNNIKNKKNLKNELEAIQNLLKGKQTTMPERHSGEGIFFTSKAADVLVIESFSKKLIFNNLIEDIFIQDIKELKGTKVIFSISLDSRKELRKIFNKYSGDSYEFSKTKVDVKLYKIGDIYISRSQGRRVVSGLDKFQEVILDFNGVKTVGQGFADEIFRVWQRNNPQIKISVKNANEDIQFMINRAKK